MIAYNTHSNVKVVSWLGSKTEEAKKINVTVTKLVYVYIYIKKNSHGAPTLHY